MLGIKYKIKIQNQDLIARCDAALHLRKPDESLRPTIREELMSTLHAGRPKSKQQKCVWKHKFYCLAHVDWSTVPCRDELFAAGLGEKDIQFEKSFGQKYYRPILNSRVQVVISF